MVVIPLVPAMFYMFCVTLLYGVIDHFETLSPKEFLVLAVIFIISFSVDMFSGILGAKYGGAKLRSAFVGFCVALIGTFIFPPFGGLPGFFIGVFLSELMQKKAPKDAIKAAVSGVLGATLGMLVNGVLALTFFVLFLVFVLG